MKQAVVDKKTLIKKLINLRHKFHEYPELSNKEFQTTQKIKTILQNWQIPVLSTQLNTGLLVEIKGKQPGATIALRADIDGLPVEEKTNLSFKSKNKGVMHACGHDLHFSSLLGAAYLLNQNKDQLKGTVKLLFQPAEEAGHGGDQVLRKNVLTGVQAIIGFHNNPNLPIGKIALQAGPLMAGCYKFSITLTGRGSHGAKPEAGKDPIIAQAAIVSQLQTIVSRNVKPLEAAVVSVTKVLAGNSWNVLPTKAYLEGTVRAFSQKNVSLIKKRLLEITNNIAKAFDQKVNINWSEGALPINNNATLTQVIKDHLFKRGLKVYKPNLSMAGEDFATFEAHIPGVFAFIGSNGTKETSDWHTSHYLGKDKTISTGVDYFIESAQGVLNYLNKKERF